MTVTSAPFLSRIVIHRKTKRLKFGIELEDSVMMSVYNLIQSKLGGFGVEGGVGIFPIVWMLEISPSRLPNHQAPWIGFIEFGSRTLVTGMEACKASKMHWHVCFKETLGESLAANQIPDFELLAFE